MKRKCWVGNCSTIYCGVDEKVTVFNFPIGSDEYDKWTRVLPNTRINVTKYFGICEKHDPARYIKKIYKNNSVTPSNPPSVPEVSPKLYFPWTLV